MEKGHFFNFEYFYYIDYNVKIKCWFWEPKSTFFDPSNKMKVTYIYFLHNKKYGTEFFLNLPPWWGTLLGGGDMSGSQTNFLCQTPLVNSFFVLASIWDITRVNPTNFRWVNSALKLAAANLPSRFSASTHFTDFHPHFRSCPGACFLAPRLEILYTSQVNIYLGI